jgi:hypothetical protein
MVYSPLSSIYYIPIALPTKVNTKIQITNRAKALKGFSMWVYVLIIVVQIYGNISILPKKEGELLFPLLC